MATYIVETTINPGVKYEVDEAEFQQLRELGILLNNNPDPLSGVFDREVAALVGNVNTQTYTLLTKLPLQPHTHIATEIADSGSMGRSLLKTTAALEARNLIGALAASTVGAASGVAQLDSGSKVPISQLPAGTASGVATLDASGKIPQSQVPAVALTEFLGAVATQAAMLALDGQRGDWCTRTDRGTDWQLVTEPSTALASWRERVYPASPVSSVDGQTGAVTTGVVAATANTTARRGAAGTLLVATATAAGEAVRLDQTTSFGRDRGSGTTLPTTDLRRGDVYLHTSFGLFVYSGSAWQPESSRPVVLRDNGTAGNVNGNTSPLTIPTRIINPATLFGPGVGAVVNVVARILLDRLSATDVYWYASLMVNNAADGIDAGFLSSGNSRVVLKCAASFEIAAGATGTVALRLDSGGASAQANYYSDTNNHHMISTVLPKF